MKSRRYTLAKSPWRRQSRSLGETSRCRSMWCHLSGSAEETRQRKRANWASVTTSVQSFQAGVRRESAQPARRSAGYFQSKKAALMLEWNPKVNLISLLSSSQSPATTSYRCSPLWICEHNFIKLSQSNLPNRCSPWYSNDIRYEIITRCQLVYHLSNSSPTIAAKYSLNLFSRFRTGPISGCVSPLSKGRLNDIPLNLIADSLILGFNFLLAVRNSIIAGQAKLDNKHKTTITTKTSRNFFRSFLFCLLINDKGNAFAWRWSEHLGNP